MEVIAIAKSVRISPRKARLLADMIRGQMAEKAIQTLKLTQKRAALPVLKTVQSAIANAGHNANLKKDDLMIVQIEVSEAQALKRYHPSTRGRVHPYKKRASHIKVVLKEAHGTKN